MKHIAIFACLLAAPAVADPPKVEAATAHQQGNSWSISVTLSHPDTGWDHYANGWRVLDMSGQVLGHRVLHHPHEQEQPFTRSLGNLALPIDTKQVQIQARCNTDGWAEDTFVLTLP